MLDFPKNNLTKSTVDRQCGIEITNLAQMARDFAERNRSGETSIPIGWLINFYQENGQPISKIEELIPVELRLSIYNNQGQGPIPIDSTWRHTLINGYRAELEPVNIPGLKISAVEVIHHKQDDLPQFATPNDVKTSNIVLKVKTVDYGPKAISGILPSLRAAYLDYDTIMQIHLTYEHNAPSTDLRFLFTGAEVNYGDMAGTTFESERFNEWATDPSGLDPSIISTLKVEPVAKKFDGVNGNYYTSANMYTAFGTQFQNILMPGVTLLPACKRYWHEIS